LTDLVLCGMWWWDGAKDHMSFCSFVLDLPKLSKLAIGDIDHCENFGAAALGEKRSLTHLWLEGREQRHAKNDLVLGMVREKNCCVFFIFKQKNVINRLW
jgi:hypothetical protein